jgi:hypothetical protein
MRSVRYVEIKVKGQVNRDWSSWFGGLQIKHMSRGETRLTGQVRDQAELRGILSRLADLGLELISVNTLRGGGEHNKKKNSSSQPKKP